MHVCEEVLGGLGVCVLRCVGCSVCVAVLRSVCCSVLHEMLGGLGERVEAGWVRCGGVRRGVCARG